jgi:hypothetical protein
MMCDIPVEVADQENVVRAIFSSQVDKKTLRKNAFFEIHDDVSVMRHSYLGSDECKKKALQIVPGNPAIKYKGLAIIGVKAVRDAESQVADSRAVYCGHAHISHGIQLPPADDPLYSQQKFELDERLREIKRLARYIPDLDPTAETWNGEAL